MGITIELQNLGDAQLCRDITAYLEHAFSGRQGVAGVDCRIASGRGLEPASGGTQWIRTVIYSIGCRRWARAFGYSNADSKARTACRTV